MPADPPPQPVQPIGPQPQPPQGPVPTPEPIQRPSAGLCMPACAALVLLAACSMDPGAGDRAAQQPSGAGAPGQGSVLGGPPSREDDCRGRAELCKQDSAR